MIKNKNKNFNLFKPFFVCLFLRQGCSVTYIKFYNLKSYAQTRTYYVKLTKETSDKLDIKN